MSTMSAQQQLRFEKKYKRRLKLATARPGWDKGVRLAQLFTITCAYMSKWLSDVSDIDSVIFVVVLVYTALFMDWKEMPNPYGGVRLSLLPFSSGFHPVSNCNKVREKFWGFFGVFTEDTRVIEPSQQPKNARR